MIRFQCYDKYMLADLDQAAIAAGQPDWGNGGPDNAGTPRSPSNAGRAPTHRCVQ